jgi:hypothetical protein
VRRHFSTPFFLSGVFVLLLTPILTAQQKPFEQFFPANTKGFVSIPNVQSIQQSWDKIALGQLAADPVIEPFVSDLRDQIQTRLDRTGVRVGLEVNDLLDVCTGEVAIGFIQPEKGNQKHAIAAIADVTGKQDAATKLLEKVEKNMLDRDAKLTKKNVGDVEMHVYAVPVKEGARKTFDAVIFQYNNRLIAVDHEQIAVQILALMKDAKTPTLAEQEGFVAVNQRCVKEANGLAPHLKWFVEPIGYAMVAREAAAVPPGRYDILSAISKQGFDAVLGVGGFANLNAGDFEILLRGYAYAPPVAGGGEEKYSLAARVLAFPGKQELKVQSWVPDSVNSYATATWEIQRSYDFIDTLVDEIAGEPGFFKDFIKSLEEDPGGPQINLKNDIVAHLGDRVSVLTDTKLPVVSDSERFLVAISLVNSPAMAKSISKMLETDPDAKLLELDGVEIWEIINEDDGDPVLDLEGQDDFDAFSFESEDEEEVDSDDAPLLMSNAAISVVHGHLMIASHVDFIVEILRNPVAEPNLGDASDYLAMQNALTALGSNKNDTIRVFSRSDEELHASYEMIRQEKMPESKGLLGRLLNQVLGPKEKGVVREQKIESKNMPDFQVVRRYLGPVGLFVRAENDGMYSAATGLNKNVPMEPQLQDAPRAAGRDEADAKN